MDYQRTLDYLYKQLPIYQRIGAAAIKYNLDNTQAIDGILGHPHRAYPVIHVAGTNGKGSVSHMLASVLQHAGYRVGLYSSPHLKDFRERVRVNGRMIPKKSVIDFVATHRRLFREIRPSFFEWSVGLAFDYFRHRKVDLAVIETGLGGRLDSTNIVTPLLSVITNVSLDHVHLLGGTLESIAVEKAGIIKEGIPVVIGESQRGITGIFTRKARERSAPVFRADRLYQAERLTSRQGMTARITGQKTYARLRLDLPGHYQLQNACTALAALDTLEAHFPVTRKAVRNGLSSVAKTTGLRGRWEVLSRSPLTICDAAHNAEGLRHAMRQVAATPHRELHFVLGLSADKDAASIMKLLPRRARYYYCRADVPRAMDAVELAMRATAGGLAGDAYPSVRAALRAARRQAGSEDLVFIGGSIFTVAEVL